MVAVLIVVSLLFVGAAVWGYRHFGAMVAFAPLAIGVVVVGGVYFFHARSFERQRFQAAALTYAADTGAWKQWLATIEPVVRGKLLVVDGDQKSLHGFHFRLPKELRPAGPADIGTVAIQRCERNLVGRYGKNSGYRLSCRFELLDLRAQTTYLSQSFEGGMPAKQSFSGDQTGSAPEAALWAYLSALPRTNEAPAAPATPAMPADSAPMLSPI